MKFVGRIFSIIGGVCCILAGLGLIAFGVCLLMLHVPEVHKLFISALEFAQKETSIPLMDYWGFVISARSQAEVRLRTFWSEALQISLMHSQV